jgi:hypothetical protein
MDLHEYQLRAANVRRSTLDSPAIPLAGCRLTAAAGAVAATVASDHVDSYTQSRHSSHLRDRLGDLLSEVAVLAAAAGLQLSDIAAANLAGLDDLYGPADASQWDALPAFDAGCPDAERFPRRLTITFRQHLDPRGRRVVTATRLAAAPAASGPRIGSRAAGEPLGDPLTDNARRPDGYRFHDAIHLGFFAVLGWSPNLRSLLRLKRKSDPIVDECEDGARAIFAEEGLAAVLAGLAGSHNGFRTYQSVPRHAVDLARAATAGLEVEAVPGWLWRRAIWQAFYAMHQLNSHDGGVLIADLDLRDLTYQPGRSSSGAVQPPPAAA